ncbi:hypothetical protein [Leptospira adleri]|uniref:hypothetical protein n=1 Tax=Leptospira adleri TaxID=2023186 RepID=UPI001FAFC8D6|nr:hypothetical protein [Leptospira adleri]
MRAKFLHFKYFNKERPFFLYSFNPSINLTLRTRGYIGTHSRAPVKHTLKGEEWK